MIKEEHIVFMGDSVYHLYIATLIAYQEKKNGRKNYLLVFTGKTNGIHLFAKQLQKLDAFEDVQLCNGYLTNHRLKKNHSFLSYLLNRPKLTKKTFEKDNVHLKNWTTIFENSLFKMFQLNRSKNYFFLKYPDNEVHMYEDGLGSYEQIMPLSRKFLRKYIFKMPLLKGHDSNVSKVFVQHPEKLMDPVVKAKAVELNLKKLEASISPDFSLQMISCMLGNDIDFKQLNGAGLIITQPVQQDGLSKEEQIELYIRMIKHGLQKVNDIFIKVHPRDEYGIYESMTTPNVHLLPQLFPLEVLNLARDLHFKIGMTYHSSSLNNLNNVEERVFYNKHYTGLLQ